MKRSGLAALAALAWLAVPAAAQPVDGAKLERMVAEAGRWTEQLNAAITTGSAGFEELNQKVQTLVASGTTQAKVTAAAPGLRRLIEQNRQNVRRSDSMLASLPAYPSGMPTDIPADRLVAEAREQNVRMLVFLDQYDAFIVAMAAGDAAGLERAKPKLMEGVFALLGQQRLMFRNRQASVPATDSSHQALGIGSQIYRAMIAAGGQGLAARQNNGAEAAAAALRSEMRLLAADTRALAASGRANLKRELARFEALRTDSPAGGAEARIAEKALATTRLEEKTFQIADRLAAFADSKAALTGAQLREAGPGSLLTPLTALENDYMAVGLEQAAASADPK